MRKAVLCMIMVVAFATMLCGISYSEAGKCVSCGSPCADSANKCEPCKKFVKCIGEAFTFDASKSSAHACGPCPATLCYTWDFGDGNKAEGVCVQHCYEQPGEYTVKLVITDNSNLGACNSDTITQVVKVNCPPTAIFTGPDCACVGSEVTFDASRSSSKTAKSLNYRWDFGDGCTGEGQVTKHTYTQGGNYTVKLVVDDGSCSACCTDCATLCIKINCPPTAKAGDCVCMQCVSCDQPLTICFKGSGCSSTGCLTYMWNFGDGSSAEGQNVEHTYKDPGVYKVTLVVDDGCNSQCSTASDSLTVTLSRQPCAEAGVDHNVCANTAIEFDGTKSVAGPNSTYAWDFGDGECGTGAKTTHMYKKCGTYKVVLTVTDGDCVSCDTACVKVNEQPACVLTGPDKACTGENITFNACGSGDPCGDPCTYSWDFGDGATVSGCDMMKACHAYEKGGVYTVKLTVDDNSGLSCATDTKTMTVTVNGRPTAVIGPCDACCVGKEILWDGSASSDPDGDKLTYSWDFGDGATGDGPKPTHVYKAAGEYKVVLKVDDGKGSPCSVSYACYTACIHESPKADLCVN